MPTFKPVGAANQVQFAQPVSAYITGRAAGMAYQNDKARNAMMQEQAASLAYGNSGPVRQMGERSMRASTDLDVARAENLRAGEAPKVGISRGIVSGGDVVTHETVNGQLGQELARGPRQGAAGGADGGMKAADSNSIRSGVATFFGGFMDETGQLRFADPTVTKRAQAVSARAADIYNDNKGQMPHDVAGKQALMEFGEEVVLTMEEKQGYFSELTPDQQEEVTQARAALAEAGGLAKADKKMVGQIKSLLMSAGINPSVL